MQTREPSRRLGRYFLLSYLPVLALCLRFAAGAGAPDLPTVLFAGAVAVTYACLYLLPAAALSFGLLYGLAAAFGRRPGGTPLAAISAVWTAAVLTVAATQALLFLDRRLYDLYGFHMNGFVWNLLKTPGGFASMEGDGATHAALALILAGTVLLQAGLLLAAGRLRTGAAPSRRRWALAAGALVALSAGERVAYGVSVLESRASVQTAATAFPFYAPTTFRKIARKLGRDVERREPRLRVRADASRLNYPLRPIEVRRPEQPLNVVWLVAESWRADMLDPAIMPETSAFADSGATRFANHYSSGNGTRMGMFGMFYGLYAPYWFPALSERRGPVLLDAALERGYEIRAYTSAKFTYPEFDKTIFAAVPDTSLDDSNPEDAGWKNDRRHVGQAIEFLRTRDPSKPFFAFLFFESPHARYFFPPESAIRPDYLEEMNYVTMDVRRDMARIENRYVNAVHHLDGQFGRVLSYLRESGLLENTIVLLTGDHGEEFMEKGHWGHNSEFTEEQIRTPLVLWVPGREGGRVERMTSHLDIAPTMARLLGVANPPEDYSLGRDLFDGPPRDWTVVGDWSRVAYIGPGFKATLPVRDAAPIGRRITDRADAPVRDEAAFFAQSRDSLAAVMRDLGRFRRKAG